MVMRVKALLRGEVGVQKKELERLRRRDAELQDYMAAIRSPEVEAVRQKAMRYRRDGFTIKTAEGAYAQGVFDYEGMLESALLRMLRARS